MPDGNLGPEAFRAIFAAAPDAYLVFSTTFRIVAATDAYLRATGARRQDIVGQELLAALDLRRSLERVLESKRPDTMPPHRYDVFRSAPGEERLCSALNSPVLDARGEVELILHRIEVTGAAPAEDLRFRALIETAPDAIVVVNARSVIELVNAQAERLFGYDRAEMLGHPLELLVPEGSRGMHGGHVTRYLAHPGRRPMGSGLELRGRRKDGTELPIEVSLSPLPTAAGTVVSAAIRDVSERHRVERERRLAAERLTSAVESIEEAFAIFDADDRLLQCNSGFRLLVAGVVPGTLVGRTHADIVSAWAPALEFTSEAARARMLGSRHDRRAEAAATIEVRTREGRMLRVVERPTPEGGLVTLISDFTDDAQRLEALRLAQQAAEEGNAAKTDFLSSMSHELRTPLNAILGFAQLLQRDKKLPLDPRQDARVAQILRGGNHLLRLIDDILDLSRIESRNVSMSIEPVDVRHVLREVVATLEPVAARSGVTMTTRPAPPDLPLVLADQTRLTQILMNFATNAIKYNRPQGHASFEVTRTSAARVRIDVHDDGLGIPLDKQPLVFQPFQRAGQETGPIEGTGIGLAITKRLAEMMQGAVGFVSTPGSGSRFWIELPARVETSTTEASRAQPGARARVVEHGPTNRRRLVLYVEDNPANVAFMEEFFSTLDAHDLVVSPTAEEAIVAAKEHAPDAILMDINLPGMSGFDALRVLKGLPETASIPVIALTAAASARDRERGESAGFYRYLAKPIQLAELEAALASALGTSP